MCLEQLSLNNMRLQGWQGSNQCQDLAALPFNDCVSPAELRSELGSNLVADLQDRQTYAKESQSSGGLSPQEVLHTCDQHTDLNLRIRNTQQVILRNSLHEAKDYTNISITGYDDSSFVGFTETIMKPGEGIHFVEEIGKERRNILSDDSDACREAAKFHTATET